MKKYMLIVAVLLCGFGHAEMIGGNPDISTSVGFSYRQTHLGGESTTYEETFVIREVEKSAKAEETTGTIDLRAPLSDVMGFEGFFGFVTRKKDVGSKTTENLKGVTFGLSVRFYFGD